MTFKNANMTNHVGRCCRILSAIALILTLAVWFPAIVKGAVVTAPTTLPAVEKQATPAMDLRTIIDDGLKAGLSKIVIPPGVYRVTPQNGQHLYFKDLKNVEIIAKDVEMVCTETVRAITFENCENVTLKGMAVDYDPLPFTQGRITAMAPDKSWLDFEIFDGYPENLEARVEIFDRKTETLKRSVVYCAPTPFESLGNRRYRLIKPENYQYNRDEDKEEVGDILVTNSNYNPGGANGHAIVSGDCKNLVLEDIRLYASNCFSYLEYNCDGTKYIRCSLDRRPLETDLRPRGIRRLRSGNADAFHSKHAVRGPQIIGSTAKWQGDDCVNISGEYYMIMGSNKKTVRVLATRDINLKVGDPVELVSYTGERLPDAKVFAIAPDGTVRAEESEFLLKQNMNEHNKQTMSKPETKALSITLDREVNLPMGSVIASMNRMGNGFLVQDCDFGMNRSRGILVKASNGKIIGNKMTGNWGHGIQVAPEWWWLESGSSNDVEIRGNVIKDCKDIAIQIEARAGNGQRAPAGAHNRITLINNSITGSPLPNIFVSSTKGLTMTGNKCVPSTAVELSDWHLQHYGLDFHKLVPVMTLNCENVTGLK
ncbi:MAG: right-handed parallel beta-helix repeat-containing protein [Verrucomicrobia bacterium]|nr:right-handed parallel beta-helix repeat-containing protein [Verrucomicrobiota bacterium]